LQGIEVTIIGFINTDDITRQCGTPIIILADPGVKQQIVSPSECTRSFHDLSIIQSILLGRTQDEDKDWQAASFPDFSDVTLFRC
jgi:hypothetical protein